jgi:alpha-mannosidase
VALSAPDAWAGVSNLAEMFLAPPIVAPLSVGRSVAEPFLTLQPDFLVLSSLTVSEDGADAVARFYNPTPQPVDAALRFGAPVQRVVKSDARGEERAPLTAPPDARQWSLEVGPAEIVTVLIRP